MKQDEILIDILQEAQLLAQDIPQAVWYGFGSYFKKQAAFSDIDVLIVCPTISDTTLVRARTEKLCLRWPLHLLVMTEHEQAETGFVVSEKCVMLHPYNRLK
jgi:hypothetical protein